MVRLLLGRGSRFHGCILHARLLLPLANLAWKGRRYLPRFQILFWATNSLSLWFVTRKIPSLPPCGGSSPGVPSVHPSTARGRARSSWGSRREGSSIRFRTPSRKESMPREGVLTRCGRRMPHRKWNNGAEWAALADAADSLFAVSAPGILRLAMYRDGQKSGP